MQRNEKLIEVLNDLIRINNDRIEGYEKAANETKDLDADLRGIFRRMADESRKNVIELSAQVGKLGGQPATSATIPGKIYRAWMDVKATFTGKDRKAILASCEFGEDAAQKAYQQALEADVDLSTEIRQVIVTQKTSLKSSHDMIKRYRDMQPA